MLMKKSIKFDRSVTETHENAWVKLKEIHMWLMVTFLLSFTVIISWKVIPLREKKQKTLPRSDGCGLNFDGKLFIFSLFTHISMFLFLTLYHTYSMCVYLLVSDQRILYC